MFPFTEYQLVAGVFMEVLRLVLTHQHIATVLKYSRTVPVSEFCYHISTLSLLHCHNVLYIA